MMHLHELAAAVNATLQGEDRAVSGIAIDTRELLPGQVFVAIQGEQFDGHDFITAAAEKKAAGVVISTSTSTNLPVIQVPDTRIALGQIALHHRQKFNLPMIALTGSCGKTTTKTMIASILTQMGPTLAPIKSFNNDIGVPLTLLGLRDSHRYAVIEMGANHPGEIGYLSQLAKQTVAMITNVAPAHLAGFGTIDGVAKAKAEIYQALPMAGTAVLNQDDPFFSYWKTLLDGRELVTFGLTGNADVTAEHIALDERGCAKFEIVTPTARLSIHLPLLGRHNLLNALAATAAAYAVGASPQAITQGLHQVTPVNKRLVTYQGMKGAAIIDDSYNANPLSVSAALEILHHRQGERIFVFGDMGELGPEEVQFHANVGKQAKHLGIDKFYAYGRLSSCAVEAFGEHGVHFEDQLSLIAALKELLHPQATVLIKGSRSSRMENVVDAIRQET